MTLTKNHMADAAFSSFGAFLAILGLSMESHYLAPGLSFSIPVLASMGATSFLVFVVPHSPMSQPWPVLGGHVLSAAIGIACAQGVENPVLAGALAPALSILAMQMMQCQHPPSAATALIAVLGGPDVRDAGWGFCYEIVAANAGTLLILAIVINKLLTHGRYPLGHSHHAHHDQFTPRADKPFVKLDEEDFKWALDHMDGIIDVTEEDLVDLYEFAAEHAQSRQ